MLTDFKKLTVENQNQVANDLESDSEQELADQFEEFLDEAYGTVSIAGYTYDTSSALRQLDPIAYRQGLLDYIDSRDDLIEVNDCYYNLRDFEDLVEELLNLQSDGK